MESLTASHVGTKELQELGARRGGPEKALDVEAPDRPEQMVKTRSSRARGCRGLSTLKLAFNQIRSKTDFNIQTALINCNPGTSQRILAKSKSGRES